MRLSVAILTPAKPVHQGTADAVTLDSQVGQLTLLAGHVPLMGQVVPGTITLVGGPPGSPQAFRIGAGGFEVTETGVVVMAQEAKAEAP